jgi:vancomycin resistance protein YoaR
MSQRPTAPDETVRMPSDRPGGRPPLSGRPSPAGGSGPRRTPPEAPATEAPPAEAPPAEVPATEDSGAAARAAEAPESPEAPEAPEAREFDDTRPVSRDWLTAQRDTGVATTSGEAAAPTTPAAGSTAPAADPETTPTATPSGSAGDAEPTATPDATPDAAAAGQETIVLGAPSAGHSPADDHPTMGAPTGLFPSASDSGGDGPSTPAGPPPGDEGVRPGRPWWRRTAVLAPVLLLGLLAVVYGVDLLLARGEVPRNTVVAGVEVGGMSPAAATAALEEQLAPRVTADHTVVAEDVTAPFSPTAAGIDLDADATVGAAAEQPLNPWTRLTTLFSEREVAPVLSTDETAFTAAVADIAAQVDQAPSDATIAIEGTTASVVEPGDGRAMDQEAAAEAILASLAAGGDPSTPIELPVEVDPVAVEAAEAQRVLDEVVTPALSAPVRVVSDDGGTSAEVPVAAIAAALRFTPQEDGELAVDVDPAALQEALGDRLEAFGTSAKDARFEVSGGSVEVVPSVNGTGVDPQRLADQLMPVLTEEAPRSVTAELGPVPAEFTTEEAEALGIREEISSFTTYFTNTQSGTNIRVVAEEVDGAVVLPGETFSLNGFTGPRGLAEGYVEAGVINNGEFTTAVGGGISQFATTMFNAVFFAGLEDIYHKPHSYYISRYPAGREATVYYDSIDLTWRNDSDAGVYIDTNWQPGAITVTFYGTKRYDIESVSSQRYDIRQPAVQEKPDDGDCTPQGGSTGFSITVTRIFNDLQSGAEIRREQFNTRYAAEPVIRCVPPEDDEADPTGAPPATD